MKNSLYSNRNIIAIDLKSFFASVECTQRGLDPFTTALVVCDPTRNGAITLAVTPFLKNLGVPSRGRAYDLPKNIKIFKAPPSMSLYIQKSREVLSIYLDYVAKEDIHVYSIDEVFLDVTDYLHMYNMTDYELAQTIINDIKKRTGLTTTAGIGPNILLAKIAMDIEAKHVQNNIAKWTYDDVKTKLWSITPLSKMWSIGPRMELNLNKLGLYTVGDIAKYDKNKLKDKYGIIGLELWEHANGIDNARISDFNNYIPKENSISHSQILFKDYNQNNIILIIREMVSVLVRRLRTAHKQTSSIGLGIGYSKETGGGFYHVTKLDNSTFKEDEIADICLNMFDKYYEEYMPIRKVSISFGRLSDDTGIQLNIFESYEEEKANKNGEIVIDKLNNKYGANMILKASSLLEDSTIRMRNGKIGGHNA